MSEKFRFSSILFHPLFSLRTFPRKPARLSLTPNLLSPQQHIISDWVRVCLSIVNEQLFFFIQENESKMSCRIITCLVFFVFTFPCAEGQFPRVCTSLTSLKNRKCCPIPKGLSAPTAVHARNWSFVIGPSSTVITNLSSKKTIAMTGLMLFTTKRANANQTLLDVTAASASLALVCVTPSCL